MVRLIKRFGSAGTLLLAASILFLAIVIAGGDGSLRLRAQAPWEGAGLLGNPYLIADVAERVTPAVVYIEASRPAPERLRSPFDDPFFRDFFPFNPWPDLAPEVSRGTGFLIDSEGHILTNQHVVGDPGGGQTITVRIDTGSYRGEVEAELVGSDYQLDLAILKIPKPAGLDSFPLLPIGDSDLSRPGEWVIAIGNPYGEQFEHTVTVGVLSAKGRKIEIYDSDRRQWKAYTDLMQTDAAINPGNSGGPLINIRGEAIGINTAVNAGAQGIGFAIPINTALAVMDQLISDGRVRRAYLGVSFSDLSRETANALGLASTDGAMIVRVGRNSPAFRGGLRVYDVVRRFNGEPIHNASELLAAIAKRKPGERVTLSIWRRGREIEIPVTLGEAPPGV